MSTPTKLPIDLTKQDPILLAAATIIRKAVYSGNHEILLCIFNHIDVEPKIQSSPVSSEDNNGNMVVRSICESYKIHCSATIETLNKRVDQKPESP